MEEKKFYLTKQKLKELEKEYEGLVVFERSKTTEEEAPKVLESEDLNPEFISFQEDMSFLRSRITELENILHNHELIKSPSKQNKNIIGLGAKVLVSIDGGKDEFVITGTLEANPSLGKISNESPVGRALMGHKVGEEVIVFSPIKTKYKIKKIKYLSS
ncbi:MAG: GreA/GreB family elongation factor [Candidatus Staskawiczbacteria bacterium]|nr:GreA/GreB family elongation factor [Candidatus Staskawiczbacteria bacterium]